MTKRGKETQAGSTNKEATLKREVVKSIFSFCGIARHLFVCQRAHRVSVTAEAKNQAKDTKGGGGLW